MAGHVRRACCLERLGRSRIRLPAPYGVLSRNWKGQKQENKTLPDSIVNEASWPAFCSWGESPLLDGLHRYGVDVSIPTRRGRAR